MDNQSVNSGHGSRVSGYGTDEINLLDYWKVIKKYRKMIAVIVGAASVVAVIASLLMTKIYRAEVVIIPVSSSGASGGLGALASQYGGLASMAGISLPGGSGDSEKLIAILKSRTLIENVINRLDLMPILFADNWDAKSRRWKSSNPRKVPKMFKAVEAMKESVSVMDDKKTKTIKITSCFRSSDVAAGVANAYLSELQAFLAANAMTTAKRNRIFIEGQLEENKEALLEAGKEINEFYKSGRVSSAEAKVDVLMGRDALRVAGDKKAVVGGQSSVVSEQQGKTLLAENDVGVATNGVAVGAGPNPESPIPNPGDSGFGSRVSGNEAEVLLSQKAEVEKKIAEARTVRDVPQQVYLSYLMLRRELLGKVNALLTTQYEMAKIEESKEDLGFQVIDYAVPPVEKFKPKRAQICLMSFFGALIVAIFIAFFREYLERMKALEQQRRN